MRVREADGFYRGSSPGWLAAATGAGGGAHEEGAVEVFQEVVVELLPLVGGERTRGQQHQTNQRVQYLEEKKNYIVAHFL